MNTKAYRLYDPLKKVFHSRDVTFNDKKCGSRSPLRQRRSHNHLFTSSIQMSPQRLLSHLYLPYDDLNARKDSPTSMVFGVTSLMSRSPSLSAKP